MRYAAKVDANQPTLVEELRQAGYSVETGHDDILVGRAGLTLWVEVKQEKARKRLKDSQKRLLAEWRGSYLVAATFEEINDWFSQRVKQCQPG